MIDNILARFPQDQRSLMTAFGILAMRPLSVIPEEELPTGGMMD